MELTPSTVFKEIRLKTEVDQFIQKECSKIHECEHNKIIRRLLEVWGIWDDRFEH